MAKLDEKTELSDQIIAKIDDDLSDRRVVKQNVMYQTSNPTWRFSFDGTLTVGDKQYIIQQYKAAGWGEVEVYNSEENEERGGLCGVRLSRDATMIA
jgi:hypothetical protein